jgi:hypothetical protein
VCLGPAAIVGDLQNSPRDVHDVNSNQEAVIKAALDANSRS